MFCREQVAQLCDARTEIERRGASVAVVGSGGRYFARVFVEDHGVTVPVYVDPDLTSYRAAGLRRGLRTTFRRSVLGNAIRALKGGFIQGRTRGDPWQQGGVFVIAPGAVLRFAHVSDVAGDHPPLTDVLAALD